MIIHMQTTIQTVFGILDDNGNAIPQQPIVVQVHRFSTEEFAQACQVITDQRDKIAANS